MGGGLESVVVRLGKRQVSVGLPRVDVFEEIDLVGRTLSRAAERADTALHASESRMVAWALYNGHRDDGDQSEQTKGRERKPATATNSTCRG